MKFFLGFSIANHVKGNKKPKTSYLGAWHYLVVDNSLKHTVYNHLSVFWRASLPFWSSHLHVLIRTLSKYAQLKLWLYFFLTWLDYTCVLWLYNEKIRAYSNQHCLKLCFYRQELLTVLTITKDIMSLVNSSLVKVNV